MTDGESLTWLAGLGVQAFDHTALALHDLGAGIRLYRDLLGGEPAEYDEVPRKGFRCLQLQFPNGSRVELLAPLGPSGFLQDFLERHGEGVHHLTFRVTDLRAAVEQARAAGLRVVDENYEEPAWQEAFVSPRSAHGTIVQLVQSTLSAEARRERWPSSRCPELNQS